MNYKKLGKIFGKIMVMEGVLMCAPLLVAFIYNESFLHKLAFIVPIVLLMALGIAMQFLKPERETFYQKEGFALTAMVWVIMTLFGAIPFVINGDIPNYIDAFFRVSLYKLNIFPCQIPSFIGCICFYEFIPLINS